MQCMGWPWWPLALAATPIGSSRGSTVIFGGGERHHHLLSICGRQSTTTFNLRVSTALIIITLRCCFWSPIILLVCVARQVALCLWLRSDLRNHIVSSHQVTQSFLPRVARPTPSSSSSEAKLSSGTVSSGTGSRAGKSDGKRSKTK